MSRIERCFAKLKQEGRTGFIPFIMGNDPDFETAFEIMKGLPDAGADLIEIGVPFTDPMADGIAIQLAGQRALKSGGGLKKSLELVQEFRKEDQETPVVLMGYYNPVYRYGVDRFISDTEEIGIDGVIIVDLPLEEDQELFTPTQQRNLDFIRLLTPMTGEVRLKDLLKDAKGFAYYVSVAGVTGTSSAKTEDIKTAMERIKKITDLPIALGFGVKTPQQVEDMSEYADAVVVGSALVKQVEKGVKAGASKQDIVKKALEFVKELTNSLK